ncbi:Peptidase S24/S26A/S26B [Penicillium concentricum]|uniref:Mitochondrial inner membrane protease subunit 2 n=1 Tax=Penicillium concentricum TaxID=293559 RepID=A0A9W9RIX6_9EURO|nr:Peptidase S24/S26A/S26B [Penicillium concentricum]KAJ5360932.1 Peptidase S24/S26A/S26B [Penicillium concentricum]
MSKPQRPRGTPTPTPNSRFRVQIREEPKPEIIKPTIPEGPSLSKQRSAFISHFITNIRQRISAIPYPVRRACRTLRWAAPILPIALFFPEHVMQVMWVRGPSMTPYLNEEYATTQTKSDIVMVNMWPWGSLTPFKKERKLERGMIVTFRSPANPAHIAIKRVIGLPGDRITTREPCLRQTQIVPWNHVWLEGDAEDPRKTLDSNTYGPVSLSLITGQVFAVLGPRMRWLKWTDWESGKKDSASTDDAGAKLYGKSVRDRVLKNAVKLEQPLLN